MAKLIVIETEDIKRQEDKVTQKQLDFIRGLMRSPKLEIMYLDYIAQHVSSRLSKKAASNLITCLLNHEEFEVRMLRHNYK